MAARTKDLFFCGPRIPARGRRRKVGVSMFRRADFSGFSGKRRRHVGYFLFVSLHVGSKAREGLGRTRPGLTVSILCKTEFRLMPKELYF